jgi:plastocyanin
MKKVLLLAALMGAVLIPAAAAKTAATTTTVSITAAGFVPKTVSVNAGDTVKWTNNDTKNHQVACAKCNVTSPVLTPTQSYSFTFADAGNFAITDALSKIKGTVAVTAPKVSVTLTATPHTVKFLGTASFSGTSSSTRANQKVTLLGQTCGSGAFTQVGVTKTATGGTYSLIRPPAMNTAYESQVGTSTSTPVTVKVVPSVHLAKIARNRFRVEVKAGSGFAGKYVLFQRRKSNGHWITSKKVTLKITQKIGSTATLTTRAFAARVRHGRRVRATLTAGQAAPCYLGSRSNTVKG